MMRKNVPGLQRGMTLIELMIAITLGLVMLTVITGLYVNISRTNGEMAKTNSHMENARFAVEVLKSDLVHAGFWGGFIPRFDDLTFGGTPDDAPTAVPEPCADWTSWDNGAADGVRNFLDPYVNGLLGIPLQVYNEVPTGCNSVVTNQRAGTDILVVRYAEHCFPGDSNCEPDVSGKLYFQPSRCAAEAGTRYVLSTTGLNLKGRLCDATLAPRRKLISRIYWVRNCAGVNSAGACTDDIPTLVRSDFDLYGTALRHGSAQPLVEGIESLRLELGIDSNSDSGASVLTGNAWKQAIQWADDEVRDSPVNRGDGVPDQYVHCGAGCSVEQLAMAVSAKVYVLARATESTPGYSDDKTYQLGSGSSWTPSGNATAFKRRVYTTTVRLENISLRRETP